MRRFSNIKALSRTVAVVGSVMVLVGGVTFAALQSQQSVIKGNTIQTAVASLKLSADGTTYSNTIDGFIFPSLVPGGQPAPVNGRPVYLKNLGGTSLFLKLSITKPVTNLDHVDLTKVRLLLTPSYGGAPQSFTLADLIASASTGGMQINNQGTMLAGQSESFTIQMAMDVDALTGPSATLSDIDISFDASTVS